MKTVYGPRFLRGATFVGVTLDAAAGSGKLTKKESRMKRGVLAALILAALFALGGGAAQAAGKGQPTDWARFYYYPYVYYPHNFEKPQEYNHLYYRYPPSRQIPVYNKDWYNFYPTERPYHMGHHFILDIF